MEDKALRGIKVLEYADLVAGPYCTKMLADFGAEVIKIEKPGCGDTARKRGPFPGDIPHHEKSGLFLYLNTNKLGVTLNLETAAGRDVFQKLIKEADLFIEDRPPGELEQMGLGYAQLAELNPSLVMTSITPFGQTGPHKNYKAYHLNSYHGGGEGYVTPGGSTYKDRPPLKVGKWVGDYECGVTAAGATLCALFWRAASGRGQHVDISEQEALMFLNLWDLSRWPDFSIVTSRFTRGYRSGGVIPCKDGYIEFAPQVWKDWENMFKLVGRPEMAEDEQLKDRRVLEQRGSEIKEIIEVWVREHTKKEIYETGQANQCPVAPYYTLDEVVHCKQLAARQFFVEVTHPEAGTFTYPSTPFKFSKTPWQAGPAPLLGQHNGEIYGERLGYTRQDLVRLRQAGVI